jgi:hypothetical protein
VHLLVLLLQGREFPNAFRADDVTVDVPLTPMGPGIFSGGFAIQWLNMTRICHSFVDAACVQRKSSEVCIAEQTERTLAAMAGGSHGGDAKRAAAIAVPVAVVGERSSCPAGCKEKRSQVLCMRGHARAAAAVVVCS